jgi:hypothetical protein
MTIVSLCLLSKTQKSLSPALSARSESLRNLSHFTGWAS